MKSYSSYKDSGVEWIGEIPSGWECLRLGVIGEFSSSGIDKKTKEGEVDVRMVNYTDLIRSRDYNPIQNGEKDYMRVTTPQSKLDEHNLKKGDMVFIPSSETFEDLGYSSLIDFEEDDIVYSYHILRFRNHKPIYHYFKKYFINHHSVLNQFSSNGKGTTRQIIGRNVFRNVRVVLPPNETQTQIVSFLDTKTQEIDELIEKTEQKIKLLKEKRTSLINHCVTKGLNPNVEMKDSGVEWIGEIPSHWTKSRLKYVSEIVTGNTPPTKDKDNYEGGVYLWVKPNEINELKPTNDTNQKLTEKGKSLSRVLPPFSVLVNGIGRIGEFGYSELPVSTNQQINSIVYKNRVDNRFGIYHVSMMKEGFLSNSEKVVVPILNKTKQENIEFIQPPISEQTQIVEYLDEQTQKIDSTIEKETQRIELLKEYRQSLISEVVTGKIDVRNWNE